MEQEKRTVAPVRRVLLFHGEGANLYSHLHQVTSNMEAQGLAVTVMDHVPPNLCHLFDAIIVPGGSAQTMSGVLENEGRTVIQNFVRLGGGYLGLCAGAHLAGRNKHDENEAHGEDASAALCSIGSIGSSRRDTYERLSLLPVSPWAHALWGYGEHLRGDVAVSIEHTACLLDAEADHSSLGTRLAALLAVAVWLALCFPQHLIAILCCWMSGAWFVLRWQHKRSSHHSCYYHNGPMWDVTDLPSCVSPFFSIQSGVGTPEQASQMEGKVLGVKGLCGKGRVVLCGGHPEKTKGRIMEQALCDMISWIMPQEVIATAHSTCSCPKCTPEDFTAKRAQMRRFRECLDRLEEEHMQHLENSGCPPLSPNAHRHMRQRLIQEATLLTTDTSGVI